MDLALAVNELTEDQRKVLKDTLSALKPGKSQKTTSTSIKPMSKKDKVKALVELIETSLSHYGVHDEDVKDTGQLVINSVDFKGNFIVLIETSYSQFQYQSVMLLCLYSNG